MNIYWVLLAYLIYTTGVAEGGGRIIQGKFFGTLNHTNLPFHSKGTKNVTTFWMTQPLDHANQNDSRTWSQRYFKNDASYKPDGPVCIFLGGEGPADPGWIASGEMVTQCSELQGTLYLMEHRFYGQSRPLPDASVESLKYLTIPQALADLNSFIDNIRSLDNLPTNKVILYGGSYSGTLVAYFAERYPEKSFISVASSGPIEWKYDFKEYLEVVGRVIKETSSKCYATIKSGMKYLENTIATTFCTVGKPCSVNLDDLKLCQPLNPKNVLDVQNLNAGISGLFSYYVQYNGLMKTGIQDICKYIDKYPNNATDFTKLASLVNKLSLSLESDCLDYSNKDFCEYISATSWDDDAVQSGSRTWTWQVCNEVGALQSTTSQNQPFGRSIPPSLFAQQCRCAFGKQYTDGFIRENVHRHMALYGGRSRFRPHVIYLNGASDPWSPMGITNIKQLPFPKSNPVFLMPGASHCNDLDSTLGSADARNRTFQYIKNLLDNGESLRDDEAKV